MFELLLAAGQFRNQESKFKNNKGPARAEPCLRKRRNCEPVRLFRRRSRVRGRRLSGRSRRRHRTLLLLRAGRLHALQYGSASRVPRGVNRERDGGDHKDHRRPCGRLLQQAGRTPRAERRLAAHAAESRGDVSRLAALQQHDDDDKETNNYVKNCDDANNHCRFRSGAPAPSLSQSAAGNFRAAGSWCGRGDLNPHAFRRHPLKMVCLPVPPLPHGPERTYVEASPL